MATKKLYKCQICGKEFKGRPDATNQWCSTQCYYKSKRNETECPQCGKIFHKLASKKTNYCSAHCLSESKATYRVCEICNKKFLKNGNLRYCSRECYLVFHSNRPRIERKCLGCGEEFFIRPHIERHGNGKYCSLDCKIKHKRAVPRYCRNCGVSFTPIKWHYDKTGGRFSTDNSRKTCSTQCRNDWMRNNQERKDKISKAFRGSSHPNWQGGSSYLNRNFRGAEWVKIRAKIKKRDKHTCQHCGIKESECGVLHVHHIRPYHEFLKTKDANKSKNLISLCRSCHTKADWEHRSSNTRQLRLGLYGNR